MKITLNDVILSAKAPLSGPLPLVEREADQGYTAAGFPRAEADLRIASDWFLTAAIRGAITSPLAAFGFAKKVWSTPGISLLALPASAVGAVVGTCLASGSAIYSSSRGAILALDAGGNIVYGAGEALMGAGKELKGVLQRQVSNASRRGSRPSTPPPVPAAEGDEAPANPRPQPGRAPLDAESINFTLAHPLAAPLEVMPAGKEHSYGSLNLLDRSVRLAGNAACTAAIRSATPFVCALGTGKEFYNRGGVSTLLSPMAAAAGFAAGAAWGATGAIVNGAQVLMGIAGAQVGAVGSLAEFTLDGMGELTLPAETPAPAADPEAEPLLAPEGEANPQDAHPQEG